MWEDDEAKVEWVEDEGEVSRSQGRERRKYSGGGDKVT